MADIDDDERTDTDDDEETEIDDDERTEIDDDEDERTGNAGDDDLLDYIGELPSLKFKDDDDEGWGPDPSGFSAQDIKEEDWEDVIVPDVVPVKRRTVKDEVPDIPPPAVKLRTVTDEVPENPPPVKRRTVKPKNPPVRQTLTEILAEKKNKRRNKELDEDEELIENIEQLKRMEEYMEEQKEEDKQDREEGLVPDEEERLEEKMLHRRRVNSIHWKLGHYKRKDKPVYKHSTKMPLDKFDAIYNISKTYILPLYEFFAAGGSSQGKLEDTDPNDYYTWKGYEGYKPDFRDYDNLKERESNRTRSWNSFALKIYNDFKRNRGNCQVLTTQKKFQEDIHEQNPESVYIYPDQILRYHRFRINDKENRAALARSQQLRLEETGARYKKRQRRHMENIKAFLFDSGDDWEMMNWYKQRNKVRKYMDLKKEWNDWKKDNIDLFQRNFKIYLDKQSHLYYILVKQYDGDAPAALGTLDGDEKYWAHTLTDLLKADYTTEEIVTVQNKLKEIYKKDKHDFIEAFGVSIDDVEPVPVRNAETEQYLTDLLGETASVNNQFNAFMDLDEDDLFNVSPERSIPPPVNDGTKKLSEEEKRSRKQKRKEETENRRQTKRADKILEREARKREIKGNRKDSREKRELPIIRRPSIRSRYDIVNQDRQVLLDIPMNRPTQQPGYNQVVKKISYMEGVDSRCMAGLRMRSKYCKKIKESNDEEDVYVTGYGYKGKCPVGSEYAIKECEGEVTAEDDIFRKADLRYFSRPPNYTLRTYIDGKNPTRRSVKKNTVRSVKKNNTVRSAKKNNTVRSVKKKNPVRSVKKNTIRSTKKNNLVRSVKGRKSPKKNK